MSEQVLSEIDLEICGSLLMMEWGKRYKRVFKFEYGLKIGDTNRIKAMVRKWGYDKTFICLAGAIRYYPEVWKSDKFKWLTINQVFTWIGEEVWNRYLNKEFKVKIVRPKI
ncbi:MAG: hypothetical protein ACQEV7_04640 [Bacillota bacterium]